MTLKAQGNEEQAGEVQKAILLIEAKRQAVLREVGQRLQFSMFA